MKKIVFIAHDPGGYDVLFPVVKRLCKESVPLDFYCVGPASNLNSLYKCSEIDALKLIQTLIQEQKLLGLITGTSWGNTLELKAIALCKEIKIPTIAVLDYWSNYQMRFQDDIGKFIYPDHYVVMDELAKQEAIQDGVPPWIIKVLGHPGLDQYIIDSKSRRQSRKKTKILFLSQPLSVLYGSRLGYTEQQVLQDCINVLHGDRDKEFYVKFHPKDKINFQQQYRDIAVTGNLVNIIVDYDLIIGMTTMGLLHAVLAGIPAISYQPNLQEADMCITNKLGLTRPIYSYQDFKNILMRKETFFNNLNFMEPMLAEQESSATKVEVFEEVDLNNKGIKLLKNYIWSDGNSIKRMTMFIRRILLHEF